MRTGSSNTSSMTNSFNRWRIIRQHSTTIDNVVVIASQSIGVGANDRLLPIGHEDYSDCNYRPKISPPPPPLAPMLIA